jgi:hypothetical protein
MPYSYSGFEEFQEEIGIPECNEDMLRKLLESLKGMQKHGFKLSDEASYTFAFKLKRLIMH